MNLKNTIFLSLKWIFICVLTGIFSGSASAFFLVALEWVTQFREHNNWIIWLLPIGGLYIGWLYHQYGKTVVKGNNLLLEEYENPQKTIPFKMAPMVLLSTLITHLFGGSAGREGTAVQMGGAIADQFTRILKLDNSDRKTLIILGISVLTLKITELGLSQTSIIAATIVSLTIAGKTVYEAKKTKNEGLGL